MADSYDVVILGGGSGGYVAAIRAAQLGLKTAVIERDKLGGTCLHYGCIPTKAFLESAHVYTEFQEREFWGLTADNVGYDYGKLLKFKDGIVDKNWKGVQFLMKKNKIDVVYGEGTAESPSRVKVATENGDQVLETKNLIVATGSRPRTFGLPIDGKKVLTSDHAVNLDAMPSSLIILGGGVISVEFASYYQSFGVDVTIVELLPTLIPLMDAELGTELAKILSRRGIKVMTGTTAEFESLTVDDYRCEHRRRVAREGAGDAPGGADAGRGRTGGRDRRHRKAGTGNRTGLHQGGIEPTNQRAQYFAVGDVCGGFGLAHEAYAEGILAVESIAGSEQIRPRRSPSHPAACIFVPTGSCNRAAGI